MPPFAEVRPGSWVQAAVLLILAAVFVLIPLTLLQRGYLPDDDALRHAAKAISGKPWTAIITLRDDFSIDHNPGWHWVLSRVQSFTHWNARSLVLFSVVALFALVALAPLPKLAHPEFWAASLALLSIVFPYWPERLMLGRPLLLTTAVTLFLMLAWQKKREPIASPRLILGSIAGFCLAAWIHGSWYLLVLVPVSFLIAGEWRKAVTIGLCWAAGTICGAIFTGEPWTFLKQSAAIPFLTLGQSVPREILVGEFMPYSGSYPAFLIIGGLLLWRRVNGRPLDWRDPLLCLAVLGCVLGFRVARFWLDWGLPALAVWVAKELNAGLTDKLKSSGARLACAVAAAGALFWATTADRDGRWSAYGKFDCLDARRPGVAEWLPQPGGILYAVEPSIFYHTFFCNPHGAWRYALGFEATFMRPEDFPVYIELCRTRNAIKACAPWVARMKPSDRLVLRGPENIVPAFPQLEWKYAANFTWIGRLRATGSLAEP